MTLEKYNGWTNYPTWNIKLWLDNDESTVNMMECKAQRIVNENPGEKRVQVRYLAEDIKSMIEEESPLEDNGLYTDILGWALSSVNWHEIAEAYLEDMLEDMEEEEFPIGKNPLGGTE